MVVTLSDPGAPFIDLARLVDQVYFAPARGPRFGAAVGTLDLSKTSRAASGTFAHGLGAARDHAEL